MTSIRQRFRTLMHNPTPGTAANGSPRHPAEERRQRARRVARTTVAACAVIGIALLFTGSPTLKGMAFFLLAAAIGYIAATLAGTLDRLVKNARRSHKK